MSSLTWLLDRMAGNRGAEALAWRGSISSYGDLLDRIERWNERLTATGVEPGQVVVLMGEYSPNSCALLLALVQRSCVVVPLTKYTEAHRAEWFRLAEVQVEIEVDPDDAAVIREYDATVENPLTTALIAEGKPGLIVFSSGSTGRVKAILHDFAALIEKFRLPRPAKRTISFLLLDHLGGINTLLHVLSCGGLVVAPESRDPDSVCRLIAEHKVEILPTSPSFLNLLLVSEAHLRYDLSSLELITYGTEPMPATTLRRLREALPDVRLQQTYGLTELGVLRSRSADSDSLWVKLGGEGFETKVRDGTLWIRARSAMKGYLNAPSPFDEEGWLNTEDEVEVDGEFLRILGRRSEIINVGGQKVYPAEVESVLMEMEGIVDATVSGEANPLTGQIVVARLVLAASEAPVELKKRVRAFCRDRLAPFKTPVKVTVDEAGPYSERFKKMRRA